jgi:short subunit dehydrogenase-like uncharacterized protein
MMRILGPFDKYGSDLVRFCAGDFFVTLLSNTPHTNALISLTAENGTHYCDITGETDWVRKMIDKYDDVARRTGARIVSFCGHDCVPWDICGMCCCRCRYF